MDYYNYTYLFNNLINNQGLMISKIDTLITYISALLFIFMVVFLYIFLRDLFKG